MRNLSIQHSLEQRTKPNITRKKGKLRKMNSEIIKIGRTKDETVTATTIATIATRKSKPFYIELP